MFYIVACLSCSLFLMLYLMALKIDYLLPVSRLISLTKYCLLANDRNCDVIERITK